LAGYAENMVYLEDGDVIHVTGDTYTIYANGEVMKRNIEDFDQEALQASK